MTDNEIIKAFGCLSGKEMYCFSCPYQARYPKCRMAIAKDVLALINRKDSKIAELTEENNRQKAKNEALQMDNEQLQSDVINANMNLEHMTAEIERLTAMVEAAEDYFNPLPFKNAFNKKIETAKAEAIKEFAEKLKAKKHECGCNYRKKPVYAVTEEKIDETYKEMVGGG